MFINDCNLSSRRVAVVDYRGQTLLCTYVQPSATMPVWDYRTSTTGIEAEHLAPGKLPSF